MNLFEILDDHHHENVDYLNYQHRLYLIRERVYRITLWDKQDFKVSYES